MAEAAKLTAIGVLRDVETDGRHPLRNLVPPNRGDVGLALYGDANLRLRPIILIRCRFPDSNKRRLRFLTHA